jgi:hypothetical protein
MKERPKTYGSYYDNNGKVKCDLMDPNWAYFMGLLHTDGHMRDKNSGGRIEISLAEDDHIILDMLQKLFGGSVKYYKRTGYSFANSKDISRLVINHSYIRNELNINGMPYGAKTKTIVPPTIPFSEFDYWRGVIDGDGSIGFSHQNKNRIIPYISFATISEGFKDAFIAFIEKITGKTKISLGQKLRPNRTHKMFSVKANNEDAVKLTSLLYYDGCLALPRKLKIAREVSSWIRPDDMSIHQEWDAKKDQIVIDNTTRKATEILGRSLNSICHRRTRLRANGTKLVYEYVGGYLVENHYDIIT